MTDPRPGRRIAVDADLRLSIDGVDATLVGQRGELALRTDEPARLARVLRRSGILPALRRFEQRMAAEGLEAPRLSLEGPRGRIASIGPRIDAGAPGAAPARATAQWHRPQDLFPEWWRRVLVGAALAAAFVLVWHRRR